MQKMFIIVGLLVCLPVAALAGEDRPRGDVTQVKAKILDRLNTMKQRVDSEIACVQAASSMEELQLCRPAQHRGKGMRPHMPKQPQTQQKQGFPPEP